MQIHSWFEAKDWCYPSQNIHNDPKSGFQNEFVERGQLLFYTGFRNRVIINMNIYIAQI